MLNQLYISVITIIISSPLLAQINSKSDVLQITRDGLIYKIPREGSPQLVPCAALPRSSGPSDSVIYRNEAMWASNGKQILTKPCKDGSTKFVKLPEGLNSFTAFEVTDNDQLVLWGSVWDSWKGKDGIERTPSEWARGILVNPESGKIEKEFNIINLKPTSDLFDFVELAEATTCIVGSQVLIAGKYSGHLIVLDSTSGKSNDITVVEESMLPPKGTARVNNGSCVTQLVPLPDGELLIGARFWTPGKAGMPGDWVDVFRTLNLATLELSAPLASYQGVEADGEPFWVDWHHQPHLLKNLSEELPKPEPTEPVK